LKVIAVACTSSKVTKEFGTVLNDIEECWYGVDLGAIVPVTWARKSAST